MHPLATTILEAQDLEIESITIPEWVGVEGPVTLFIHQLSADESVKWTDAMNASKEDGIYIIVAFAARDKDGNRIFASQEEVDILRKKNFNILNRIQNVALRLNKFDKVGDAILKKDSGGAPDGASPTA